LIQFAAAQQPQLDVATLQKAVTTPGANAIMRWTKRRLRILVVG
jgi:hypothetical protein